MLFHELVQLREGGERPPVRPPGARDVAVRAPARLPFEGELAKWWAVEVRFDRPLARREVRRLEGAYDGWTGGLYGADGMVWGQWWNSYPSPGADGAGLVRAVQRVGVPGIVRTAPFGRDCPGGWACAGLGGEERCELGRAWSCSPVFTLADWIAVWPTAWRLS